MQLLIGHFLLFQDRSLRPEEIEGETWPLKGKGCSATQETGGREIGGKRGRDGLQGQGLGRSRASSVEPGVRECAVLGSSAAWFSKPVDPWVAAALRGSTGLTSDRIHLWFLPQSSERPSENLTRTRMATSTVGTWATACVPWATCPPRWSLLSCPNRST